ncbi:hypothetical protein AU196_05750 [Mycobacterium sp. IS-1742]|uniref:YbaB/EbfC family nucleoid-associated protein n=1 Tax=Mycobacterium sp. IS-1742 TaxID=1772285 RepID=UPI00073FCFDA|nr:YbaB/EbfC family nucleoid-associated protein [Mycobacterium sp. IS-1742]KUI30110.1 hypothetical protein AU196_05750 [Mycobacterium sp. IS-1742]
MFDELARICDDTLARARARADALAAAADALAGIRTEATSPDGDVRAAVDGRGLLVSMTLAESVTRLPASRIAALVVETTRAAAREAFAHRQAVLGDVVADLGR